MRSRPSRNWPVATFLAALILTCGPDAEAAPESTHLSDLPLAAQVQISAVLGRDQARYHALARGEGLRTENREHNLVTTAMGMSS
jgi:hypothetical protein